MDRFKEIMELPKETLEQQTKSFMDLDMGDFGERWLGVSYLYGLNKGMTDYEARSFSSELTLFLTGKLYNTGVELIYKEDWLDSHIYNIFTSKFSEHNLCKDNEFWTDFIDYLEDFYVTDKICYYERVKHQINIKLTEYEYAMFMNIPLEKNIEKFNYLLDFYKNEDFQYSKHLGKQNKQITFKLGESTYSKFMNLPPTKKSEKFLFLLYYYIHNID